MEGLVGGGRGLVVVPGPVLTGAGVSILASFMACCIRLTGGAVGLGRVLVPTPVVVGGRTGGATCRGGGSPMRGISGSTGGTLATSSNNPPKASGSSPRSWSSSLAERFCTNWVASSSLMGPSGLESILSSTNDERDQ